MEIDFILGDVHPVAITEIIRTLFFNSQEHSRLQDANSERYAPADASTRGNY